MGRKLDVLYRNAAEEFARRVMSALGDQIDAIVLYGSAARHEAKRYSDVDILIVGLDSAAVRGKISDIRSDLVYEGNFAFLISLVYLGRRRLRELLALGSPFIGDVLSEGVVLYDNGTFSGIREEAVGTGGRNLGRRQVSAAR